MNTVHGVGCLGVGVDADVWKAANTILNENVHTVEPWYPDIQNPDIEA